MEKLGIIDLGSNSARLVIVELFGEGHFMVVDELKESVRLGQDMERDGFLKPQRVAETIRTLKMFKKLADASKVDRIIAVATAAVRRAKNQRSFLDEIQATCGIKVRVLGEEEEATTVDIFSLDRLSGEAVFYKSAAAPSYIKRGESIYRIKSETVPLGLTKELDTEKSRVEVKSGDYIIILSDGLSGSNDSDTAMLLEYLNKARFDSVTDFAEGILDAAVKRSGVSDDMTVTVIKLFNRRPEPKGKKAG